MGGRAHLPRRSSRVGPRLLNLPEEFLLLSTVYDSWVRDTFEKDSWPPQLAVCVLCHEPIVGITLPP